MVGKGGQENEYVSERAAFVGIRSSGAQGAADVIHSQHEWSTGIAFVSALLINHTHTWLSEAQRVTSDPPVSHVQLVIDQRVQLRRVGQWPSTPFTRLCPYFLSSAPL
jgi:hypothetical protein